MKAKLILFLMLVVMCFYLTACTPYVKSHRETETKPLVM